MSDDAPRMVRVECPRCGRSEVVPEGDPASPWLPKVTEGGPFMVVTFSAPLGETSATYCRACWADTLACLVSAILPPTTSTPIMEVNAHIVEPASDGEQNAAVN